jgi:uncharacterized membrane protein
MNLGKWWVMDLDLRVDVLEKKVIHLEQQLNILLNKEVNPQQYQINATSPSSEILMIPGQKIPLDERMDVKSPPPRDWEHLIARVWLPRIFIVVFLLGVLWGFTAAINAGMITPEIRCILGIAAAGVMYWQGEVQIRRNRLALGQVLLGGAMGVLILSLFAAHMLFGLIPSGLAFLLYMISIGASVYIGIRHRSQALTIIALIAGYLVPFLVNSSDANVWIFVGYEAMFSMGMILISLHYSFRAAYFVAFGVLHLPLLFAMWDGNSTESRAAIILAVFAQHLLLYVIAIFQTKGNRMNQPVTLYMSFGLLVAWMYGLYGDSTDKITYEWMILLWSILYSVTSVWLFTQKRALAIHLSIATLGWFLWLIYILNAEQASAALLAEGAIALCLGIRLDSKLQKVTGVLAYLSGVISVLLHPIKELVSMETFAWLVLVASVGGLYLFLQAVLAESKGKLESKLILIWSESVLLLIFFTQITNVFTRALTFDYQHLVLSAVWVFYAIIVIFFGLIVKKRNVRLAGLLFLFISLLKIIFVDLPDVSIAVRAILFIGLGAIGVATSRLFYKGKA